MVHAVDSELRSVIYRYSVVAVVLLGALIWTVVYTDDKNIRKNVAPLVMDAGVADTSATGPTKAPSLTAMFVQKDGVEHVSCVAACRLEAYCELRTVDACLKASCIGDLRIGSTSDAIFARSEECPAAAVAPCEEACARQTSCDAAKNTDTCVTACRSKAQGAPATGYQNARCAIESKTCDDVKRCGL